MGGVTENLATVRSEIETAANSVNRDPTAVTLIAVSKTFDADDIRPVLQAGQRVFGENRVQEAEGKWPQLREEFPDVELHLIGPLQTNKVKHALPLFDVIQTVDRPKLARTLADQMDKTGHRPDCFIQVNTGEEDQKAGIAPADVDGFVAQCRDEFGLPIVGLMCIPPVDEQPSPHFALLSKMADRNGLKGLSMGMSADYQTAVMLGATHVRVGSAIFGKRDYP
jgi:hypothetical protein